MFKIKNKKEDKGMKTITNLLIAHHDEMRKLVNEIK